MKETVVSGIRPTGKLHLGNYYGALQNFIKMQNEFNCYFFIADLHSLTTHPKPAELHATVKHVLAEYLAAGIDPEKCTIYLQSDVPEIAELYLFLNMNAYLGELERSTSFKDKVRSNPNNVNAGLLTYPVMMAADILIHKATKVPVGKDQEPHLEMARDFGNRFNRMYGAELFPEPYAFSYGDKLLRIPGLDGQGKMSKSNGDASVINLSDEPGVIQKKVMRAVTDSGPTAENQQMPDAINNLFLLFSLVSDQDEYNYFLASYNNCTIRYGDFKKALAANIIKATDPIRKEITEIENNAELLRKVATMGKEKARDSACNTVREVKELIGFKPF